MSGDDAAERLRRAAERVVALDRLQNASARCTDGLTPETDEWWAARRANPWPGEFPNENGECVELLVALAAAVLALLDEHEHPGMALPFLLGHMADLGPAADLLPDDAGAGEG